jgi:iron(III) transport system ATP-binding protein
LEQADEGTIRLAGKTMVDAARGIFVPPEKRGVGMVFQNYALWPHMTVAANVEFPLRARGMQSAINKGRAREALEIVQCAHLADRYPPQLSGGQQQRIALARALSSQPEVMLLDEPLSNLDALLRIDLRAQLRHLHGSLGFTGIYVTHDQVEAMNLGTRVVVMRAGRIEQIGAPEVIYNRPANEYVAEFLGMRNRLTCTIAEKDQLIIGNEMVKVATGSTRAGEYQLRTRPSEILLRPTGSATNGTDATAWIGGGRVIDRLPSGESTDYIVELSGETLFVEDRSGEYLAKDQPVEVGFKTGTMLFYEKSGNLAEFSSHCVS